MYMQYQLLVSVFMTVFVRMSTQIFDANFPVYIAVVDIESTPTYRKQGNSSFNPLPIIKTHKCVLHCKPIALAALITCWLVENHSKTFIKKSLRHAAMMRIRIHM